MRTAIAQRCSGRRPLIVVRPLQMERSASGADHDRPASQAPPTAQFTALKMSVSRPT
jgi:hypothetical protein